MKTQKHKKIEFKSEKDLPLLAVSLGSMSFNCTGTWRNVKPVIDYERCNNCGICWKFCPDVCIYIEDERPVIDYYYCKGCMVCVEECPRKAIESVKEE